MTTNFSELVETGLDANSTSTVTDSLDIKENKKVALSVNGDTGTHNTHIVSLQCSVDDTVWTTMSDSITGESVKNNVEVITRYVRAKVTTAEGGVSTVDICIQAK